MHILDWEWEEEIEMDEEKEKEEVKVNNKRRAELMDENEWRQYNKKVREELGKNGVLKEQEEKLNKREGLTEKEVEEGIENIE